MIRTDDDLRVVREQLERMQSALESLHTTVRPVSEARFQLMAEAYFEEIQNLRSEIDAYLGIEDHPSQHAELILGIEGEHIQFGRTPGSVIVSVLDQFRKGLQSLISVLGGSAPEERRGRPSRWLQSLSDPPILGFEQGSIKICLGEPFSEDLPNVNSIEPYYNAIELLLDGIEWANDSMEAALHVDDPNQRLVVLNVLKKLIPSDATQVEALTFGGRLVHRQSEVRLTRACRERISAEVKRIQSQHTYVDAIGVIREIDLDSNTFILRNRIHPEPDLSCAYIEELEVDVKDNLDKRVVVSGTYRKQGHKGTLYVDSIDSADLNEAEDVHSA